MKAVWNRYGFVSVPLNPMIHDDFPSSMEYLLLYTLTADVQGQKMNGKECQNLLMGGHKCHCWLVIQVEHTLVF